MIKTTKKRSGYYVTNEDLLAEVILFKERGYVSENLGKMLLTVATHYSSKSNFSGYTWRQDMVSESICTCIKYLRNFNPEKSNNAFAYITQIMKNAFKLYIIEQKKHSRIKDLCYKGYDRFQEENKFETYVPQSLNYETILEYVDEDDKTIKKNVEIVDEESDRD